MRPAATFFLSALLVLSACGGTNIAEDASGEDIYLQICARCHAANLTGGLGPALVGDDSPALERSEAFFNQTISAGLGRMPSFGGTLSEIQVQQVTEYILGQQGR